MADPKWEIVLPDTTLLTVTVLEDSGTGMPDPQTILQPYGTIDGGIFQKQTIPPRVFALKAYLTGSTLANLMTARKTLIDAVKPDRVAAQTPFTIRYTYNSAVEIKAVLEAGLSKGRPDGFTEMPTLRFLAPDPYFVSTTTNTTALDCYDVVADGNRVMRRTAAGQWVAAATGFDNSVSVLAIAPDGTIYAGGAFHNALPATAVNHIARWDGAAWLPLGTGMNGDVYDICFGLDGTLYATGAFTTAGGGAANYIAKWNGAAWSALGTGLAGGTPVGNALACDQGGQIYVGGNFTTAGGVAAVNIARWNGAAFSAVGPSGFANTVHTLAVGTDGSLYAGGEFHASGATTLNHISKFSGSAWAAIGPSASPGLDDTVYTIIPNRLDGTLYAGGAFILSTGGKSLYRTARINGSLFENLSWSVGGTVYSLGLTRNGVLHVGGALTTAGNHTIPQGYAIWIGQNWFPPDLDLSGAATVGAIAIKNSTGEVFLGFDTAGATGVAGLTTITNAGTATAYPVLRFTGPGALYRVENLTTGDLIGFGDLTLNTNETAVLDLSRQPHTGPDGITTTAITFGSNQRTELMQHILPGSDLATFRLIPGANSISTFINDVGASATIAYKNRYWSIDGAA